MAVIIGTSFKFGNNLFDIYFGYSQTEQANELSMTQFGQINMNKIIPLAIYFLGPSSFDAPEIIGSLVPALAY